MQNSATPMTNPAYYTCMFLDCGCLKFTNIPDLLLHLATTHGRRTQHREVYRIDHTDTHFTEEKLAIDYLEVRCKSELNTYQCIQCETVHRLVRCAVCQKLMNKPPLREHLRIHIVTEPGEADNWMLIPSDVTNHLNRGGYQ